MSIKSFLKGLPIDIGQAEMKHTSAGKMIAFSFVPKDGSEKKALDIGCRDGYWSERLKSLGYGVTSLDIEPHYQNALTQNVENGLPFPDQSFDVIWCTEVIEHLYKPEFLLSEIERILKPGGKVILTTPNSSWWLYFVVRPFGWTPQNLQNSDHKQFFSEKDIRKSAKNYDLFGYFPYALFFIKITKFIGFLSPTFVLIRRSSIKNS